MKTLLTILMAAAIAVMASAADNPAPKASILDKITVAPLGVLKTADIDGPSQWGAGLDLGYKVNSFVSLHVVNLSFEGPGKSKRFDKKSGEFTTTGEEPWGGLLVDETDFLVQADITKFKTESFVPYFIGGGLRDWNSERWGIGVGAGGRLQFNKYLSAGADYSIRFYSREADDSSKDSLLRAFVQLSF